MEDFFKSNSPAMRFLTTIFNLIAVNILFLITSLPVFTIGAAFSGLMKVTFEIIEGEEVFLLRDFFRAYISNFARATAFWVPSLLLWAFFGYDVLLVWNNLEGTAFWMMVPPILFFVLISCINIYIYPLLALFRESLKQTLKNALLLAIGNMPTTIMLLLIHAAIISVLIRIDSFSVILGSLMMFIGIALVALFDSVFIRRTFRRSGFISLDPDKITKAAEASSEEDTADEE